MSNEGIANSGQWKEGRGKRKEERGKWIEDSG